ncbi:MAG: hypothetical protein JXA51_00300 [Dehalococcoidales bacterium]|nr:hypothetical protein [Dehalococcoidales bacterium]
MADETEKNNGEDLRQARREEKKRKEKERMKKHGKSLGQIYRDAMEKRKKDT